MAMSGIKVNEEVKVVFNQIKDKHTYGHAIMKIGDDQKEIVVEKSFEPHADKTPETSEQVFNEMKDEILKNCDGPRYILFDFSYQRKSGTSKDVVVYIYWCSDSVPIKKKMVYAASNEALKKVFAGIKHYEVHDEADFTYKEIADDLISKDRA